MFFYYKLFYYKILMCFCKKKSVFFSIVVSVYFPHDATALTQPIYAFAYRYTRAQLTICPLGSWLPQLDNGHASPEPNGLMGFSFFYYSLFSPTHFDISWYK
ncbi:Os09g0567100 [Oryza sativa Japonica Group]|uniref:Os09g0567100 protein n=2 Tax=Oryza sativa subsp. japonica TaxID=39947 RepID=B7EG55_ORYSJ|nr:hypothetical protein DAI22_09g204000 [Oryza sativa Japonica Group]BAF25873.1 Os09g0567100 [Oryza sativa Japonica Group]BAG91352.1 unnamed protein product [Oryza sativa Japonica Group]|eukprot:NP_001063959.1 Os09g0567100 [Oryza sativa Japonica Group]